MQEKADRWVEMRLKIALNGILRSLDFFCKNENLLYDFILFLQKLQEMYRVGLVIPILQTKKWRLREGNSSSHRVV